MSEAPRWALPLLVLSQLMCCSTWFAANAVLQELLARNGDSGYSSPEELARSISVATALVQAGFIFGTLVVAGFSLADRYPPHAIFAVSALAAALSNVLPVISTSVGVLSPLVQLQESLLQASTLLACALRLASFLKDLGLHLAG